MGAVTDPSTLRRGGSQRRLSLWGAVVFGLSSPRKHPGLAIIGVFIGVLRVHVIVLG